MNYKSRKGHVGICLKASGRPIVPTLTAFIVQYGQLRAVKVAAISVAFRFYPIVSNRLISS